MSILDSSWVDDELRILHEQVLKFTEQEMGPHREAWEAQGMCDREAWNLAGSAGLLCASIPEQYGGAGGDYTHEAIVYDAMMRGGAAASVGGGNTVHSQIVAHYILNYGSEEQKQSWLPKIASGELVGAIAMTEPGAGSDLQAVKTTARLEGGSYRINGAKTFITNGQHAELIIVVAKTDPTAGARGTSLLVVETRDLEGFARGRNLDKIGLKDADTSELFFNDVVVPADSLLGEEEGHGGIHQGTRCFRQDSL
jgi:acyl-CoA dehydrogenase